MKELKKKMQREYREKQNSKLNWLHLWLTKRRKENKHQRLPIKKNWMK